MTSPFAAAVSVAAAAGTVVAGERIRIIPLKPGRYTADSADTTRATITIAAMLRNIPSRSKITDSTTGRDFDHKMLLPKILAVVQIADLGANKYGAPDRIEQLNDNDAVIATFSITAAEPDGPGRLVFSLVAVNE